MAYSYTPKSQEVRAEPKEEQSKNYRYIGYKNSIALDRVRSEHENWKALPDIQCGKYGVETYGLKKIYGIE